MLDLGWNNSELAERSGVTRPTIDRLRSGKRPPAVKTVHKLADALHIDRKSAEQLAGLAPDGVVGTGDGSVRAAVLASKVYTDEQKQMLLSMIDTIERANGTAPTDRGKT
jgi:transcriptional regulator with XRE-family HTH domain